MGLKQSPESPWGKGMFAPLPQVEGRLQQEVFLQLHQVTEEAYVGQGEGMGFSGKYHCSCLLMGLILPLACPSSASSAHPTFPLL